MTGRYLKALIIFTVLMTGNPAGVTSAENPQRPDFIVAYSSKALADVDPKDAAAAMKIYVGELARLAGYRGESYVYDEIADVVRKLKNGDLDFLALSASDYLRTKGQLDVELAFAHVKSGKSSVKYLLLTNKQHGFTKLSELKGKTMVLPSGDELAAMYLDTLLLRGKWGQKTTFFSSIIEKTKPSQAALAVFFGQADACITTDVLLATMVEMNPQLGKTLQIIASSPEVVTTVTVFRKGLNPDIRRKVIDFGISAKNNPRGRQVLTLFKIDSLISINEADLAGTRELVNDYERLRFGKP